MDEFAFTTHGHGPVIANLASGCIKGAAKNVCIERNSM